MTRKLRLKIKTEIVDNRVTRVLEFKGREWLDRQLLPSLILKHLEISTHIENLQVIEKYWNDNCYISTYELNSTGNSDTESLFQMDGNYFFRYPVPYKTCSNCTAFNSTRRFCYWKDETLRKEITGCDGFLEKGNINDRGIHKAKEKLYKKKSKAIAPARRGDNAPEKTINHKRRAKFSRFDA